MDNNNLPNGMNINPFEEVAKITISLQDINYVKLISEKLKEIKDFGIIIDTIDIKEDLQNNVTSLMLVLSIKEGENNGISD